MASFVYFKFKSQKEPQRVTIDGPHTDVWNLKREIISISRLGDGTEFDLKIYKENSNEGKRTHSERSPKLTDVEYTDDTEIIPKDSTVLARRLPASAPGKGRAARYVSGKPPVSAKPTAGAAAGKPAKAVEIDSNMTEEERLKAIFQYSSADWQRKQEEMALETRVPMQGGKPKPKANVPEGEPPFGYVCFRCQQKGMKPGPIRTCFRTKCTAGHWIQACPTNNDAGFDNRARIKRTTGIPRSMLKKIDQEDIDKLDEQQRQHLMVNAEGDFVFAQADEKTWKKHLEQLKASEAGKKDAAEADKDLEERGLACPVDKRLFVDPMKTPCCGKTYCHDCIENALLENDLTCPGCETENVSLEALVPDDEMKEKIKAYQAEKTNEKQRSRSPSAAVGTPKPEEEASGSRPVTRDGSKTPTSENGQGKKRTASEANESVAGSLEVPAMKRQKSGEGTPAPEGNDGSNPSTPADTSSTDANAFPANMMPPDFSQMQNMGMNFNMGMPNMMGMPFMGMPNMNMNMMGMGMGMMPNMNMMNMMGGMNAMNAMNGMGNNNNNFNHHNQFPSGPGNHRGNFNNKHHQFRNKRGGGFNGPAQAPKQPEGLANVPTGPKAMQNGTPAAGGGFYPPSGPAGNKFANQQRYAGNEEDNAYMRQPVNPGRQWRGRGRGKPRDADYKEV